jgi:O-antigen ligase
LGGFLVSAVGKLDILYALRETVKPWMTIVGLPWLALRAISEDKVPRLIHVTVIVTCLGATVGLLQIAAPDLMNMLLADVGRAEGLWSNPNTSGAICAMVLFLSLHCPFKSRLLNWSSRLLLLAAVGASLSRGAILALVLSWVVYTVSARRFGTLIKSSIALVLFVAATLLVLGAVETSSRMHEQRIDSVRSLLSGRWDIETFKNRTDLWGPSLDAILSQGGLVFGLGHGSMVNIVGKVDEGIAPHNYYIYVLGNSGLFALVGLLAFHFFLAQQAFRCSDRQQRAALFAIAAYLAMIHLVDHSLVGHPMTGAVLACVMVSIAYARPRSHVVARSLRHLPRDTAARQFRHHSQIPQWRISPSRP